MVTCAKIRKYHAEGSPSHLLLSLMGDPSSKPHVSLDNLPYVWGRAPTLSLLHQRQPLALLCLSLLVPLTGVLF